MRSGLVGLSEGLKMKGNNMSMGFKTATSTLALLGIVTLTTPSFAVEPDTDSPAGPELPAPRTDRPDFQQDDQSGAVIDPETEGADPRPPSAELVVPADPDLAEPVPPPAMPQP
jgi:hypothetical protein